MFNAAAEFFHQFGQNVRFADAIDVLLVAAFLYALLTWVRRDTRPGTTWRMAFVLVAFAAVYLLAGVFSLYLVGQLLGVLFVAFLVAAVVLFQSEIRRMIDRIGAFSFRRSTGTDRGEQTLDILTEASGKLAEERVGALMAVRGRDSWEGVTQGGIGLNGSLSLPLLDSIFHEDTDGHDGAVLIEKDRAVRFGAHLPLAAELPEASRAGGTRHAAGLGLSEQCDAFVIVVSEERGTISVAERGELVVVDSASDLRERLGRFWNTHHGAEANRERWWSAASVQTAALALLMACLFWLTFAYEPGSAYRNFTVPVVFENVEPTWLIEEPQPAEVSVGLTGSERAFEAVTAAELAVSFELSELEAGVNQLLISEDNMDLPGGLRLEEARPPSVQVRARRLRRTRLPVSVQNTQGPQLPDSLRLRAAPDSVDLLVPRNGEDTPTEVRTEAVSLDSLRASGGALQADLLAPTGTRLPEGEARRVDVRLDTLSAGAAPAGSE